MNKVLKFVLEFVHMINFIRSISIWRKRCTMNYPFINPYFSIQQGILILFVFVVACVLSTSAQYDNEHSDYIAEPSSWTTPASSTIVWFGLAALLSLLVRDSLNGFLVNFSSLKKAQPNIYVTIWHYCFSSAIGKFEITYWQCILPNEHFSWLHLNVCSTFMYITLLPARTVFISVCYVIYKDYHNSSFFIRANFFSFPIPWPTLDKSKFISA